MNELRKILRKSDLPLREVMLHNEEALTGQPLAVILAGYSAELWGWRGAMFVPAGVLAACSIVMFLFLKEHPDDVAAARAPSSPSSSGTSVETSVTDASHRTCCTGG